MLFAVAKRRRPTERACGLHDGKQQACMGARRPPVAAAAAAASYRAC